MLKLQIIRARWMLTRARFWGGVSAEIGQRARRQLEAGNLPRASFLVRAQERATARICRLNDRIQALAERIADEQEREWQRHYDDMQVRRERAAKTFDEAAQGRRATP